MLQPDYKEFTRLAREASLVPVVKSVTADLLTPVSAFLAIAEDEPHAEIRGRDLVSGLPKTVVISAAEVRKAIEEPVNLVVDAVKNTLDKCPPELAGDVMDRGIALTGGGALLRGLESRIREETGMPVQVADNPLDSVVLGTGKCVEDFDTLHQVLVPDRR